MSGGSVAGWYAMNEVWRLATGVSRSVSAENPTGAKGAGGRATDGTGAPAAGELGPGWKISPSIVLRAGETATLADLAGPGIIEHIWLTTDRSRLADLRLAMTWDEAAAPAVDVPLGSFFCLEWGGYALVDSDLVVVAPAGGLNSYWPMPFATHATITLENASDADVFVYYQVDYRLRDLPPESAYLHARHSRAAPLGSPAVHTVLDGAAGPGQYAGTYLAIRPNAPGWWGEGEFKFFLDGDDEFPTICGTGTEDYFGGAWNFDVAGKYVPYSTRYLGLVQVLPPDAIYRADQRSGMYRWHVRDPISFAEDLRVTVQALGWGEDGKYLPLTDADIATTAFWYSRLPG